MGVQLELPHIVPKTNVHFPPLGVDTSRNRRCPCATRHGYGCVGWQSEMGRMATKEEFVNHAAHDKALRATEPSSINRRRRIRKARSNGPRSERGAFLALARCNYPGWVHLFIPHKEGCWR